MQKIFQTWGGRRFVIEIDGDQGIRVYDANAKGERIEKSDGQREIWIDPHRMIHDEKDVLQVHIYTDAKGTPNSGDQEPATINVTPNRINLVNDAGGTMVPPLVKPVIPRMN